MTSLKRDPASGADVRPLLREAGGVGVGGADAEPAAAPPAPPAESLLLQVEGERRKSQVRVR